MRCKACTGNEINTCFNELNDIINRVASPLFRRKINKLIVILRMVRINGTSKRYSFYSALNLSDRSEINRLSMVKQMVHTQS